ncbi:hypothetical protein ACFQS3_13310 [Glycomyces mayteni]|uniref:DUF5655 domain-containing protein n=1 Tax=Glycomyces mayteni TaxID=543887 RepID=A0ABW2DAQ1_9ACTN|nr:hypothetical protein GCM10025732_11520 [Glycomyces mayteni]
MQVAVEITASTGKYADDSPQWRSELGALYRELESRAGRVALRSGETQEGHRGTTEAVIIALGSSGAITAAVTCFRLWLDRDKTRTLDVEWTDPDETRHHLRLTGENIDRQSFQALAEAIGRALEGR